ncbi:hypothetical protein DDO00_003472 [Vibrio cholerae]
MHRTLQYRKKAIQQAHLDNVNSVLPFEAALYEIAQEEQQTLISKIALKRKGILPEVVHGSFVFASSDWLVDEQPHDSRLGV